MPTKSQTWALVVVVLGVAVVVWVCQGGKSAAHLDSFLSYVVSGTWAIFFLWDRWLWRWAGFHPWLTDRPDLRGTWKGELRSSWPDPETGVRAGPIETYLVIRQSFSSIEIRGFSLESESASLSAGLTRVGPGLHRLFVVYRNEPKALLRDRSPIHYGGMLLNVRGPRNLQFDGHYWTDRRTRGEAQFSWRVGDLSVDFGSAAKAFVGKGAACD